MCIACENFVRDLSSQISTWSQLTHLTIACGIPSQAKEDVLKSYPRDIERVSLLLLITGEREKNVGNIKSSAFVFFFNSQATLNLLLYWWYSARVSLGNKIKALKNAFDTQQKTFQTSMYS